MYVGLPYITEEFSTDLVFYYHDKNSNAQI